MDTGRLKTIVILILLCVNLAFGGILLSEKLGAAENSAQTRSELREVMAGLGIDITEDQIPAGSVLLRQSVARERSTEDRLVTALLGSPFSSVLASILPVNLIDSGLSLQILLQRYTIPHNSPHFLQFFFQKIFAYVVNNLAERYSSTRAECP